MVREVSSWRTGSGVTSVGADVMHTSSRDKLQATSGVDQGRGRSTGTNFEEAGASMS